MWSPRAVSVGTGGAPMAGLEDALQGRPGTAAGAMQGLFRPGVVGERAEIAGGDGRECGGRSWTEDVWEAWIWWGQLFIICYMSFLF